MLTLATALINGSALWKIVVAAFVGGAGVAIAFGVLLLGLSRADSATGPTQRAGGYALSAACAAFCIAAVAVGVYAIVHK
jgi:hypothetical protein